jgi:polyisoprenoid-binding protein YceI
MKIFYALLIGSLVAFASCTNSADESKKVSENELAQTNTSGEVEMIIPDGMYLLTKHESTIVWTAKKLSGSGHTGIIPATNGKFKVEGGQITGGQVTLDMIGFTVTDLEGEDKEGFDGHLKSSDFLDVEKYPTAEMKIKGVKSVKGNLIASILLNLHGGNVDYEVPVSITAVEDGNGFATYEIRGEFFIDRTKHKIIYGSGTFFDNLGDRAIKDDVHIKFVFTAM